MSPDSKDGDESFETFYTADRARHYRDKFAADRVHRAADRAERRAVGSLLSECGQSGLWLDVPSGAGRFEDELRSRGFRIVAGDVSAPMLELCRDRIGPSDSAWTGCARLSAFALPFRDASFDGALCLRFLHHFSDAASREAVLREIRRVVRTWAVVSFFDARSWQAMRRSVRSKWRGRPTGRHSQSVAEFRDEARAVGFTVETVRHRAKFISEWSVARLRVRESS